MREGSFWSNSNAPHESRAMNDKRVLFGIIGGFATIVALSQAVDHCVGSISDRFRRDGVSAGVAPDYLGDWKATDAQLRQMRAQQSPEQIKRDGLDAQRIQANMEFLGSHPVVIFDIAFEAGTHACGVLDPTAELSQAEVEP